MPRPNTLSFAEGAYLDKLEDGMTVGELARAVGRYESAASRTVQRLVMAGRLTVRAGDGRETRIYHVEPTVADRVAMLRRFAEYERRQARLVYTILGGTPETDAKYRDSCLGWAEWFDGRADELEAEA